VNQIQAQVSLGQHPGAIDLAEAEGPEPVRIAHADQFVLGHDDQRVGALDAVKASHEVVALAVGGRLGQQMQNDLAIDGGRKIEPLASSSSRSWAALVRLPLCAMAILAAGAIDGERLGVAQVR
jgi:hypothetical protein